MKNSLFTAICLTAAALPALASSASYDPEVDFDRPGRVPFHSVSPAQPPARGTSAAAASFDPEVDADRPGRTPLHAVSPHAAPTLSASFDPEVDSDWDLLNTVSPRSPRVAGSRLRHPG